MIPRKRRVKFMHWLLPMLIICISSISCHSNNGSEDKEDSIPPKEVPSLFIVTQNGSLITSKEDYINCSVTINGQQPSENYNGSARIRGRGNSTWLWYDKKPYRIKLDEKAEILGLTSSKDWILLANYRDPTHLMNAFGFEVATYMRLQFTNHTRYVEVTLNGNYIGLYQLTEQVEVSKSRVNIDEKAGYLLSLDLDDGPDLSPLSKDNFLSQVFNMPICVKSPKDQTAEQLSTIQKDFAILENAINNYNYNTVNQWMDVQSFIDFLLIQELTYNVELAAPRSVYMYKDKGGKYFMGPVWDFDAGFDFDWSTMYTGHTYFASYKELVLGTDPAKQIGGIQIPRFFTQLFKSSAFVAQYKARWNEISNGLLTHTLHYIDETASYTTEAMKRDYVRWPIDKQYAAEIERLKKWITQRAGYMTTVINNIP